MAWEDVSIHGLRVWSTMAGKKKAWRGLEVDTGNETVCPHPIAPGSGEKTGSGVCYETQHLPHSNSLPLPRPHLLRVPQPIKTGPSGEMTQLLRVDSTLQRTQVLLPTPMSDNSRLCNSSSRESCACGLHRCLNTCAHTLPSHIYN